MTPPIKWKETPLGWRADMDAGVVLFVNRAHRGGGWVWELNAFNADDDKRGIVPTDASGKHLAEKAYRAWHQIPVR